MSQTADLERLLAHADWLRALARRLVGDADADDVVQETLLTAMRAPPDVDRPPRPWLARVLRNRTRMRFRSDSRRVRREEAVAMAPIETIEPEQIVQRLELQRTLCELVLALDEPFRTTLVHHYFDGATLAELARRAGVPEATMRWRHKQALERLRAGLDHRSAGDRRAWIATLAPQLAGSQTSVIVGGLVVKKLVIGAIIALIAGTVWWRVSATPKAVTPSAAHGTPTEASGGIAHLDPAAAAEAPRHVTRLANESERRRIADRIATSQSHRSSARGPAPSLPDVPAQPETLSKTTIRAAMHEVIPYLTECYAQALPTLPSPELHIQAHLTLSGDPDVGTLVDASQHLVDDRGQPLPAKLDDCLRSTFQTLELPPLAEGDKVEVTYPFLFNDTGPDTPQH